MEKLIIGVTGVILGAFLTLVREFWSDYRTQKRKATYLAIRVACILEHFIDQSVSIALDDGAKNEYGLLCTTTSRPELNFESLAVDWQSLPHSLMYDILNFPSDIEEANQFIDSIAEHVASPPDYDEFFEERQYQYSKLGLKAHDLAETLRSKYNMPKKEYKNWNPINHMTKIKKEIEVLRKRRENEHKNMFNPV